MPPAAPAFARVRGSRFGAFVALSVGIGAGCGRLGADQAPQGVLAELALELRSTPLVAPRLSISSEDGACRRPASPGAAPSHDGCATSLSALSRSDRIREIAERAERAVRDSTDPQAMHAAAVIRLLYPDATGQSLQRSISALGTAARLADRPAPILADLAAAYLVRAERAGTPRDLLAAIEAAETALRHEPGNPAVLFNRALALQRFGLVEEAVRAWHDYLTFDSTSTWAGEARRHRREALTLHTPPPHPAPDAAASSYAAYAAADPQGARVLGWCNVLGAWARAALNGDPAGAARHLQRAEALGTALTRRAGGDATLADGVRAIRAQESGRGWRKLARAHREFATGCESRSRVEFRAAAPRFAAAAAHAEGSATLRMWARLMYGSMIFHSGDMPGGEAIFRELAHTADPARHPALVAHARQLLAVVMLRRDRHEAVLEQASRGADLFVRAGERENEGVMLDALSNAKFFLRDMDEGYILAHRALERLRPYRTSYRLHNLLSFTAEIVSADGFPLAAVRMQDEGVRVAERTGNPVYVAEARLTRARLRAAAGAPLGVGEDVAIAQAAIEKVADPEVRGWLVAQRQMAEATTLLHTQPLRAAEAMDSAAAFYLGKMKTPLVAFPAVVEAARARLAAGDTARGMTRLVEALSILEQRRDWIRMEPRRAAVFEDARTLVDRMTMLKLASGRTAEALRYQDRGRASLATVGRTSVMDPQGGISGPKGDVALVYTLVGDTLLTWTVAGRRLELFRAVVDTASLIRTIEHVRSQLEDRAGESELRPGLSQLYEWLVRPLAHRLGGGGTRLVVVADGDLSSIPFAALYDSTRRRYLVEDHPLRSAASLREAWRPARRATAGRAALFVADPAFDPRAHPGFERLSGAAEEVREIAAWYPGAHVLSGTEAHLKALREALNDAGTVHYAGHAVFDDARPERSYLLLAHVPGQRSSPTLEAGQIAQLDLSHLSLVVLSACQTVQTGRGRAAGFSGLAGAFLAAGAGGAVGSLWEVDDRLTRPLMVGFHHAYRSSGDGPGALRMAQLRLLRSRDPALRSPAAWAGFRYAGS